MHLTSYNMDVLYIVLFALISSAMCQNENTTSTEPPTTSAEVTTTSPEVESRNCSTARHLAGSCVERRACNFSTNAVDLTLYMPHGYKSVCVSGQVCCPLQYIIVEEAVEGDQSSGFDSSDY